MQKTLGSAVALAALALPFAAGAQTPIPGYLYTEARQYIATSGRIAGADAPGPVAKTLIGFGAGVCVLAGVESSDSRQSGTHQAVVTVDKPNPENARSWIWVLRASATGGTQYVRGIAQCVCIRPDCSAP